MFGLPRPLGANQSVVVASPKRLGYDKAKGKLPRLGARTWLYWEDLHYGARFTHPSRLLLVDDRTGRTQLQRISWYPLVDGVRSLFLRSRGAYQGARYKVFSNVKPVRRASRVAPDAAQVANALPQKAYAEDCILMAGLYYDALFEKDFEGMAEFAASIGVRAFYAQEGRPRDRRPPSEFASDLAPDGKSLAENVSTLVKSEDCKDILIYLGGHGLEAGEGNPAVITGDSKAIYASDLRAIAEANRETTFKIKIDSCFSGRFLEREHGLTGRANILLIEASASARQWSRGFLPFQLKDADGKVVTRAVPNPELSEFTHANITGMKAFVGSQTEVNAALDAGGSLFARMLKRGFELGAPSDGARIIGFTTPQIDYDLPSQPLFVLNRESHTHPSPNPGFSYVCKEATSEPGTMLTLTVTGPEGFNQTTTFTLPWGAQLKKHVFSYKITKTGEYLFRVTAKRGTRTITRESTYRVPGGSVPNGPFPCPPPP